MPDKTIAERLADFGLRLRFKDLPPDAVHEAKRRIIDSFACALGAYDSPPARIVRELLPVAAQGPCASVIGHGGRTTPEMAAFANGVMIRYLDYNDTYLSKEPAHPSDNIPAALAAAEAAGRTGEELLTAVVAAYEVQCRLCDAASLRSRGFDHVTYGAFSSTLAASLLFGLSRDQIIHALGMAGVSSPALRQTRAGELSMWKGCAFANAARNAVFLSGLAKNGMTGPAPVFEGEFGFFKLISGAFELPAFAPSAGSFKIVDTYIKYYPSEYHSQSAVGAACELSGAVEDLNSIESITVSTFRAAYEIIGVGKEKRRPKTRETADHSLPFCVAAALLDGTVTVETFSEERLKDTRVLALIDRIEIKVDEELDRLYPEAMPAKIDVRLVSGDILSREIIYPKGHPKNPVTDLEVEQKFRNLALWYFTDTEAGRVIDRLWRIEEAKSLPEVMEAFGKGRYAGRP